MTAPVQDARVIAWLINRLRGLEEQELPDGWVLIELIGGPYDGMSMGAIPLIATHQITLTLPTTPADRPGGACYAVYESCGQDRAHFRGISEITPVAADRN